MNTVDLASTTDIPPGEARSFEVEGRSIAVYNVDGEHFATNGLCPHRDHPLGGGVLDGRIIVCPLHAWRFDVTTGESPDMPAARVRCLQIEKRGERLHVELVAESND